MGYGLVLLRDWPLIEAAGLLLVWGVTSSLWRGTSSVEPEVLERTVGAQAILGQLTGTITASSILLAAVGAIAAIGGQDTSRIPWPARSHLILAAVEALLSLAFSVWALGTVPPLVRHHNASRAKWPALFTISALFLFLAGACRVGLAIHGIVRGFK